MLNLKAVLAAMFVFFAAISGTNAQTIEDEAVDWLQAFLQVDTINPPGNEIAAVEFYAAIFEAEGIEYEFAESAPGRGNIWARLPGGNEPALILIQHTDVVPADPNFWTTDPLGGEVKDGYLYGRGAIDMKSLGIMHLAAFLKLHRSGKKLNRDVVFLATADEEAGGLYGAGWLVENHPEIFEGAGLLWNESGSGTRTEDGSLVFDIEVTQKVPVWLRLTAVDQPSHGSTPRTTSSVSRIVEALDRIWDNPFPARMVPAVDNFFKGLAQTVEGEEAENYANMADAINKPDFLENLRAESPWLHALTRDTCSLTRMGGSNKINVVPPSAWAEIDCRMLPDRPSAEFVADMEALLDGTGVEAEVIMAFTPAVSDTDSDLYRAMSNVVLQRYPDAKIIPGVSTGFTDSHFTRDLGIDSYGFNPAIFDEVEGERVHGNDERIHIDAFREGTDVLIEIVEDVVYDQE